MAWEIANAYIVFSVVQHNEIRHVLSLSLMYDMGLLKLRNLLARIILNNKNLAWLIKIVTQKKNQLPLNKLVNVVNKVRVLKFRCANTF